MERLGSLGLLRPASASPRASSAAAAASGPPVRIVQLAIPSNAREGDVLLVQTEHGQVEVPIRAKIATLQPGKQIHVEVPVPADLEPSKKLVVEDVKVSTASARTHRLPLTDIWRVFACIARPAHSRWRGGGGGGGDVPGACGSAGEC